jgi:methyl-accepting chemotaxis protein
MKSIKLKLILIFTAVILILTMGMTTFTINAMTNQLISDANDDLINMAVQEAKHVKARIEGRINYVSALAQNPIILDESIEMEEKIAFFEAEAQRAGYLAFAFADLDGNATVFNQNREITNIGARDYFQRAVKGTPSASDLLVSSATHELVMIFAAPVYKDGEIVGVIYARRDGNALSEIVSAASYGKTGYAYMINNQGVTVGHANTDLVYAQENAIEGMKTDESLRQLGELTQTMITGSVGNGVFTYGGATKMVGYAPIENTPWTMVFGIEQDEVLTEIRALQQGLMLTSVIACLAGALVTYIVSDRITKPLRKITDVAQKIAHGDLDVSLDVGSKDEVGRLADAFNLTIKQLVNYQSYIDEISNALLKVSQGDLVSELQLEYVGQFKKLKDNMEAMLSQLNATMMQINEAAHQVDSGAEQVSSGAQALSQGATEQASSIEQLSATVAEITHQINQNATNSKEAYDRVAFTGRVLQNSNDEMRGMVAAMGEIGVKSGEISKIIKVIEDIAFQTNILALNAAVEAARAGSAGKGFAVVADEVRNLAAKSAEAARDTTALISETLAAVENGSQMADTTAKSIEQTVQAAEQVIELINRISQASDEQARAINQINLGVEQVSSVVQTNAATAEQSAAASEELSGQSRLLRELIAQFRLRKAKVIAGLQKF